MTHHRLKALPSYFDDYVLGVRPWSLRNNDRFFQPRDTVTFYEWDGEKATGHESRPFCIMAVWRFEDWLPEGHVMLSIRPQEFACPCGAPLAEPCELHNDLEAGQ